MAARALNAEGTFTRSGALWGATQVRRVVRRAEPSPVIAQPRIRSRGRYIMSGLTWCWCGSRMMVARIGGDEQLVCYRGRDLPADAHPRPIYRRERSILPWVQEEASRLHTPEAVEVEHARDETEHARLTAKRARVLDMFADGLVSKIDRDRRLADVDAELRGLEVRREVIAVPSIDWSWDPGDLNVVLRAIFERIDLGRDLMPVSATWRVPEWRSPE
jgi:hypothetical protein